MATLIYSGGSFSDENNFDPVQAPTTGDLVITMSYTEDIYFTEMPPAVDLSLTNFEKDIFIEIHEPDVIWEHFYNVDKDLLFNTLDNLTKVG